jgi:hypothetical protein
MQVGNGAVAVLDSLSFSVLYTSYLGTYIVETLNHDQSLGLNEDHYWFLLTYSICVLFTFFIGLGFI